MKYRHSMRPLVALFTLVLLVRSGLAQEPSAEPPRLDVNALHDEIDRTFALPAAKLGPRIMIFPVVDARRIVRHDGHLLGFMATISAHYGLRKRLAMSTAWQQEMLWDTGCVAHGKELDDKTIGLCLAAADTKLYVVPMLNEVEPGSNRFTLESEFHGDGVHAQDKVFQHPIAVGEIRTVPGLIAEAVLSHLKIPLSPAESAEVLAPQLRSDEDLGNLNGAFKDLEPSPQNDERYVALLKDNPRCIVAWGRYLDQSVNLEEALSRYRTMQPPVKSEFLDMLIGRRIRNGRQSELALKLLLPLAATHRDDGYYRSMLTRCGMALSDDTVTQHLLDLWKTSDYANCTIRGALLIDWAWQARGDGWAFTVTPAGGQAFEDRLKLAQQEMEQAIQVNPSGWTAHRQLIVVAMGRSLPRDFMERHFAKAVEFCPTYQPAYAAKLNYLKPRWHGTKEDLLAFGEKCAATGYWEDGIPQLFQSVIEDYSLDGDNSASRYSSFRDPALWKAFTTYYQSALEHGGTQDRRQAINSYAKWGVAAGRFEDVVVPFQMLRDPERFDESIFGGFDNFLFFYRLVHAQTGRLSVAGRTRNDRNLCHAVSAVSLGDIPAAEHFLTKVDRTVKDNVEPWRKVFLAVSLGKKLRSEGRITLTPGEITTHFEPAESGWAPTPQGSVFDFSRRRQREIFFPVGIRHGVISGTFEYSGGVVEIIVRAHTRGLRDEVWLDYQPQHSRVQVVRNRYWVSRDALQPGPQAFRIEYGKEADVFQPYPGKTHEIPVHDDVPSGFSIEVRGNPPASVTLRNLTVELTK